MLGKLLDQYYFDDLEIIVEEKARKNGNARPPSLDMSASGVKKLRDVLLMLIEKNVEKVFQTVKGIIYAR